MTSHRMTLAIAATAGAALFSACGSSSIDGSPGKASDGPVLVVASTNVYGDIAESIGGPDVEVTSVLSDPAQDPHSFEANPRTALAISKADMLIENGGGYDDYMDTLRKSSDSNATVVNVVELSGRKAAEGEELNEHVWYDLPTVQKLAARIADDLAKADSEHTADFEDRAKALTGQLDELIAQEKDIAATATGKAVGVTEPVPLYLSEACGLINKTPEEFMEAIEEGDDIAPPILQQTLDMYRAKRVDALLYNEQTAGPITERVKAAATNAGVPVVPVTETLSPGMDYVTWMRDTIAAVGAAVGG